MSFKKNVTLFCVTDFCNAKCKYCSFWKTKKVTTPPKEDLDKIIYNIRNKLNSGFLQITGGEPLSYPHIFELIEKATKSRMITQLMTNGSLLNTEKIGRLDRAGLKMIDISVDHYDPAVVDKIRGIPGLLNKNIENIKNLKKTKMVVMSGVTISKYNINDLEKVTEFVTGIGVDEVNFCLPLASTNSTYALGNSEDDAAEISNGEMVAVIDRLLKIKEKYGSRIAHRAAFFRDIKKYYQGEKQNFPCTAGQTIFYLDNRLDVYQCMTKDTKLGTIFDDIKPMKNVKCYECPIQCFREGSIYLYGLKSIPSILDLLSHKSYWKILFR